MVKARGGTFVPVMLNGLVGPLSCASRAVSTPYDLPAGGTMVCSSVLPRSVPACRSEGPGPRLWS